MNLTIETPPLRHQITTLILALSSSVFSSALISNAQSEMGVGLHTRDH